MTRKRSRYALLIAAAVLSVCLVVLAFMIQNTRANLLYGKGADMDLQMSNINVQLMENGKALASNGDTIQLMAGKATSLEPGYTYQERIAVSNTSGEDKSLIPEYVRVIVRKYWVDQDGAKLTSLDPDLIQLRYNTGTYNRQDWVQSEKETTAEQVVYYLKNPLEPGASSQELFDGVMVDSSIADKFTLINQDGEVIENIDSITASDKEVTAKYDYDGAQFRVEVEVQSVQSEHGEQAVPSAWGSVRVENGSIVVE
ncbi:MAG: hypothetical protein IJI20_04110 [Firmicutes bacterium]|nr:hypothetical protein [Bacillota bacterium]